MPLTSKEYKTLETVFSAMKPKFLADLISRKDVLRILKEFVENGQNDGQENTTSSENGDKEHK